MDIRTGIRNASSMQCLCIFESEKRLQYKFYFGETVQVRVTAKTLLKSFKIILTMIL